MVPAPGAAAARRPDRCARAPASGIPAGVTSGERLLAGWNVRPVAPPTPRELVAELSADVTPLVAAGSPPGRRAAWRSEAGERRTGAGRPGQFVDWSMTIVAPVALELGWFTVSNSGSLPEPPELVLERYRKLAGAAVVGDGGQSTWRRSLACCCADTERPRHRSGRHARVRLVRGGRPRLVERAGRSRRGPGCAERRPAVRVPRPGLATGGPQPQDDPRPVQPPDGTTAEPNDRRAGRVIELRAHGGQLGPPSGTRAARQRCNGLLARGEVHRTCDSLVLPTTTADRRAAVAVKDARATTRSSVTRASGRSRRGPGCAERAGGLPG